MKIDYKKLKEILDIIVVENVPDIDIIEGAALGFYPMKYAVRLNKIKNKIYNV